MAAAKTTKAMTKTELFDAMTTKMEGWTRRDAKDAVEILVEVAHEQLQKKGVFALPGMAKFIVIKKPATKARKGVNPFTKAPCVFAAKPARKVVKARPVKALREAVA
jgi:DNA-binding protein HU-beta